MFRRATGTCFDRLGETMVLLTTIPIGRLLLSLDFIMHESHQVILEVLPLITFMELARMQIAS